jgi:transcriptional regulator with XRE-family HTH domain
MNDCSSSLKYYRCRKGISQRDLSKISGVSLRLIQHYEQGFRDISRAQVMTVCKLASALGVTVEELLCLGG